MERPISLPTMPPTTAPIAVAAILPTALADLIAEDAAGNRADDHAGVGLVRTLRPAGREQNWQENQSVAARNAHEGPRR